MGARLLSTILLIHLSQILASTFCLFCQTMASKYFFLCALEIESHIIKIGYSEVPVKNPKDTLTDSPSFATGPTRSLPRLCFRDILNFEEIQTGSGVEGFRLDFATIDHVTNT